MEPLAPLDQRLAAKVDTIEVKEIEDDEDKRCRMARINRTEGSA